MLFSLSHHHHMIATTKSLTLLKFKKIYEEKETLAVVSDIIHGAPYSSELDLEERVNEFIVHQYLSQSLSSTAPIARRVCFIHSVLIPTHGTVFLTELLDLIWDHGLAKELSGLWVY